MVTGVERVLDRQEGAGSFEPGTASAPERGRSASYHADAARVSNAFGDPAIQSSFTRVASFRGRCGSGSTRIVNCKCRYITYSETLNV